MAKKERKWVVAPRPGPHKKFESFPLQVLLRDVLKIADTGNEARKIIKAREVLVDGRKRKDHAYPVGLFDVVSIPKLEKFYRIVAAQGGLKPVEIPAAESGVKIFRVEDKTVLRKGKIQLNLSGGKNLLTEKSSYRTGDSILVELGTGKIVEHFSLKKGSVGVITSGANSGNAGKVKEIIPGTARSVAKLVCEIGGEEKEVARADFIVVGDAKPAITVVE